MWSARWPEPQGDLRLEASGEAFWIVHTTKWERTDLAEYRAPAREWTRQNCLGVENEMAYARGNGQGRGGQDSEESSGHRAYRDSCVQNDRLSP